ncbi:hypothetical protein AV944_00475 [Sphingomonas sp. LK11]|nr:hypothetical protein AV944_00475 [Sphingomonas sp. LK11]
MVRTGRATVRGDASRADRRSVSELLRRHLEMARVAEVARVVVDVQPAQRQRLDVIDDRSRDVAACLQAALA